MENFYRAVVKKRKIIMALFLTGAVISIFLRQFIEVNYDMNDYLPEESPSTLSIEKMEGEFGGGITNCRIMVRDVTIPQALNYKEKIAAIDGVTEVTWLDDSEEVTKPLSTLDGDATDNYYQDGCALYSVTVEDEKRVEAIEAIRKLIGEDNAMDGSAVVTAAATTSTVTEIQKIALGAVAFALLVLILTTTSWAEPLILLFALGVAVLINNGTNLMFGEVSFVTNAAGNILQMAVSLDYSVFLLHRFMECRRTPDGHMREGSVEDAMVEALCKSTSSILSSGLTTVIGFLALCLMRFRIGPDLGLALAKGIALSLISVFLFAPALILSTYKWIDKTKHRPFVPSMKGFGRGVCKIMIPMVCLFAVAVVPAYLASNQNEYYYGAGHIFSEDTVVGQDRAAIEEKFGIRDTYVLMVPRGNSAAETGLCANLRQLPQVVDIISYGEKVGAQVPTAYLDEADLSKLLSEDYSRLILSVEAGLEGSETFELVENIRRLAEEAYPGTYYLAGEGVSTYDLMKTVTSDMVKVNFIAIGAVFFVLLLTLKSVTLPLILVLTIETAIWVNLSIPYFAGKPVFYIAYLIISSVQLGATVDYAILFTDRYNEFRETLPKKEAITETISAVTVSIFTSGTVLVVVGFLLGAISSHQLLSQLGYFVGKGTLCSLAMVMFVLPGLLYGLDGITRRNKKGFGKKRKGDNENVQAA